GPATKARFIPSDPKSTHLGVGVVHLYRDVEETPGLYDDGPPPPATKSLGAGLGAGDSKSTFDEKDCTTLCILAVPSYLSPSDFMGFVGEKTREEVSHFRMIRTERTNRYMVLMKFREARKARAWRKEWNGKAFDSMGPETCHVVFIKSIHFQTPDGSSDPVKPVAPPTPSLVELPTCPVCLERMDETTGLLTIVCQHVFHCECLHKWRGSGCPICRYTQGQGLYGADGSSSVLHKEDIVKECSVCASDTNLWICLICGNVGCGRYDEAHAFAHYTATSHSYAMDLVTQRVWDYAGDGYVHRLIHNTPDGKFVDLHSSTSLYNSDYPLDYTYSSSDNLLLSSSRADADNKLKTHLDSMGMEYTHLLTCQLESQRAYFEEKLVRAADKASHASATAESALTASSRAQADLADLQAAYDRLTTDTIPTLERDKMRAENRADKFERTARFLEKEYKEEKAINESLLERIKFMESQLSTLRGENEDLKELNRDLGFYLSAGEKL
ncbi:zf-UBP-domain-containing protein, partial [Xylona heveae TC161]